MSSPTTTPTLTMQDFFSTTLSANITASDTVIPLNAVPTGTEGFLVLEQDNGSREVVYYTSKTSSTVTCPDVATGRGQGGTTATSHSAGVTCKQNVVSQYLTELQNGHALGLGSITPEKLMANAGTGWAWQSWTPSWTNLTATGATIAAAYCQIGKLVFCRLSFAYGSGSAVGSDPQFTLPVTASSSLSLDHAIGTVRMVDTGNAGYPGNIYLPSTTKGRIVCVNTAGTYAVDATVTASVPFTWGSTDGFYAEFCYEAA